MDFKPIKRTSISEQIFEQLKEKIISGEIRTGDKLPSENELCKIYGVSRTTIRQALLSLSGLDLIETRFGEGSFVKRINQGVALNALIPHSFLSEKSIVEIIEFRRLIEPNATHLACEKATDDDIRNLEVIYNLMVKNQNNLEEFSKLDYDFHIEIAKISKNSYVIKIYEIIKDILLNAFSDIVMKRGNEAGLKYHKLILDAFINKNPLDAQKYMQQHMEDLFDSYT